MKACRPVLHVSVLILAVGIALPLIALRSFEGYIQARIRFLGMIAPAALLVVLLFLYPRLRQRPLLILTVVSMTLATLAWAMGGVNILFFLLFLLGALAIPLNLQRRNSNHPDSPGAHTRL
jgi:hypothetical protein